jgi:hypothetical protein
VQILDGTENGAGDFGVQRWARADDPVLSAESRLSPGGEVAAVAAEEMRPFQIESKRDLLSR